MYEDDDSIENDYRKMPLYLKGEEIRDLVIQITDLISEDEPHLSHIKQFMLEDAHIICVKIAGAEGGDLYDIRMECAAFIRRAANDLMVQNHTLEMFGFEHANYYKLVRDLLEEYRVLFVVWVAGFDKWNYIPDSWGLFNPPGVNPE
jgi:hypothetical protein